MANVGGQEICRILAGEGNQPLSLERVRQLVRKGMPQDSKGEYDAVRCMYWYLGELRRIVANKETENEDGSSASNIRAERKRLLRAQADREELELAALQKQMVTVEEWESYTAELVVSAKARIMAVPSRVAPRVVGETNRVIVQGVIEKELKTALAELAKHGGEDEVKKPPKRKAGAARGKKKG